MKLWRSTIVIWSDFDPKTIELSHLAREAESGDAYCSLQKAELINDPANDENAPSMEFFGEEDET